MEQITIESTWSALELESRKDDLYPLLSGEAGGRLMTSQDKEYVVIRVYRKTLLRRVLLWAGMPVRTVTYKVVRKG